ncbi:MAG: phosphatase PAP2 family protein [Roseburia sp.]|nr:phosphatase PAP2 family protein [Roseburia sp.]MCM1279759.1 phosphatase PAP2 family protein [Robinsoniella sp.]
MKQKILGFLKKYKHALLPLLYFPFYMLAFSYLERTVTTNFALVHMRLDDYIPFIEYFVIPYYLWFPYIAVTVITFIFLDKRDYYKLCITLGTGMTLFLLISFLIPNGHDLRPLTFERNNIFTTLIKTMYTVDTPTNLFPSIHCYNSLMAHTAIMENETLKKHKGIQIISLLLCVSIVLSTMFIKQHSVFDVFTALALSVIMYLLVYRPGINTCFKHFIHKRQGS